MHYTSSVTRLSDLRTALTQVADPEKAAFFPRFFKSGPGEYAEGDKFIGVTVPACRMIAKTYSDLPLADIHQLIASQWHEERLVALIILTLQYVPADQAKRQEIYDFYLNHTAHINNWDLVDTSAYKIVGRHIYDNPTHLPTLDQLAASPVVWERRIAMVSSFYFLQQNDPAATLHMAETLVGDSHDLIQKAVGWMLREMGKRVDQQLLVEFLAHHYHTMPRTTLRYAIEHFSPATRGAYLAGII